MTLNKYNYIFLVLIAIVALSGCEDSPEVAQAKLELAQVDEQIAALETRIAAIPKLELSKEVKQDLKIQVHAIGVFSSIENPEEPGPMFMKEFLSFISAVQDRNANIPEPTQEGPEQVLEIGSAMVDIISEDLEGLERMANVYDSSVELARSEIKDLSPLTVPRTKDTERYFQDFERKKAEYEALAASLDSYGPSNEFRLKVEKLKKANTLFEFFMDFIPNIPGRMLSLEPEIEEAFPSIVDEAEDIESCYTPQRDESKCNESNFWNLLKSFIDAVHEEFKKLES